MTYIKTYISKGEKLWFWLIGLIVFFLAIYIVTLNFAVSEVYRMGEIEREVKLLRQDLQLSEGDFIERLSVFYDQYSESFNQVEISKQEFVSRQDNFALSR